MPQLTLSYSAALASGFDARAFAVKAHHLLVKHADADLPSCKTRILRLEDTVINDGAPTQAMLHLEVGLLSGRTQEQKTRLDKALLEALTDAAPQLPAGTTLQITMELRDMDRPNYHKRVIKT